MATIKIYAGLDEQIAPTPVIEIRNVSDPNTAHADLVMALRKLADGIEQDPRPLFLSWHTN